MTALPSAIRGLEARTGPAPRVDTRYPCPQLDDLAPQQLREQLLVRAATLAGVSVSDTRLSIPGGRALVLDPDIAHGQPEAFITGRELAIVTDGGSVQLTLPPDWGQELLDRGWATIHPLARYLAGALPPQSLILYAPRDPDELEVAWRSLQAAHGYARGTIDGQILPDTQW